MQNAIEEQILKVAQNVESQLDAELQRLEDLDQEGIDRLREQRMKEMRKQANLKKEWLSKGHGTYEELSEEGQFFEVTKQSEKVVVHFFRHETARCKIFDHHIKALVPSHLETRFVKLDAEKSPFLTGKLGIRVLPTLVIVVNSKAKDKIVGFTDLGNCDDFSTEMLEWRLARSAVIDYDGDLLNPPEKTKARRKTVRSNKTIRESTSDNSDSD